MEVLGKLTQYLKKASSDFQFDYNYKKSCLTWIAYSQKLNQIIVIKFPERKHYISYGLAHKYLESSRLKLQDVFGQSVYRNTWILNILISNRLTKSCFDLVTPGKYENMDMLFNLKWTNEKETLHTIFQSLATKLRNWSNEIKKSCSKTNSNYRYTSKGTVCIDRRIEPYGEVKEKIKSLDAAADILEVVSHKYNRRDG